MRAIYRPERQSAGRAVRLISTLALPVQGLLPALAAEDDDAGLDEPDSVRQLAEDDRAGSAGAGADDGEEEPRRLSSSCFQLDGREERVGVTAFLGLEADGRAGAGAADEEGAGEPPARRLSSSCFQLAGRAERVGVTAFLGLADGRAGAEGAAAAGAAAGEPPARRLSSSCFQLAGSEERVGVTAFWLAAGRAGAEEGAADSVRQLAEEERAGVAGAGAGAAAELLPFPLRRLSSSCFQLAGSTERVGLARLGAEEERAAGVAVTVADSLQLPRATTLTALLRAMATRGAAPTRIVERAILAEIGRAHV